MESDIFSIKEKVFEKSNKLIDWYKAHSNKKRRVSKLMRAISIIFVGIGGLCPLLNATGVFGEFDISKWGYVAFTIAGIFIGYDKFFGVSSGWVRYTLAIFHIEKAVSDFEYDWEYIETTVQDLENLSKEERQKFIVLTKRLAEKIASIEQEETEKWASEFENSITELRKTAVNK